MILYKETQKIVDKIADELDIPKHVATVAYRAYWKFIKDTIEGLPDISNMTEEELAKVRVNFNMPSLGKFTTNYKRICNINKFKEIVNERTNNKKGKTLA